MHSPKFCPHFMVFFLMILYVFIFFIICFYLLNPWWATFQWATLFPQKIYLLSSKPWFNREMSNQFIDRKPPTPARALSSRHPLLMGQGLNLWCMETLCISTRHCLCVFAGAHTHNAWYTSIYLYMHECKYIYIRTCIYYISTRMCI